MRDTPRELNVVGLRECKRERTRETIRREAFRLIMLAGYDATTCEQIAAAAGVSPATLFRYFPTKEDIVLQDDYDPMIAEEIRARPARESPLLAVRRGFAAALAAVYQRDLEEIRQRTALILSVPALKARSRDQQDSLVAQLTEALADRARRAPGDLDVEVSAHVCAAAVGVAVERWARAGGDLPTYIDAALDAVSSVTKRAAR